LPYVFHGKKNTIDLDEKHPFLKSVAFDFTSCAVIGNSGLLKKFAFGDIIDKSESVFRMNAAPIVGYEKHVGSKTTLRFVNMAFLKNYTRDFSKNNSNVSLVHWDWNKHPNDFFQRKPQPTDIFFNSTFLNRIWSWQGGKRTSGWLAVFVAIKYCKEKVDVFGFGVLPSSNTSNSSLEEAQQLNHYFDENQLGESRTLPFPKHRWDLEMEILKEWHRQGVIRLYPDPELLQSTSYFMDHLSEYNTSDAYNKTKLTDSKFQSDLKGWELNKNSEDDYMAHSNKSLSELCDLSKFEETILNTTQS